MEEIARIDGSHAATLTQGIPWEFHPSTITVTRRKKTWLPDLCRENPRLLRADRAERGLGCRGLADERGSGRRPLGHQWFEDLYYEFYDAISPGLCRSGGHGKETGWEDELSCILVPNGTPGFTTKTMHGKMVWRSSNTGELYFTDCRVPKENLLGRRGDGFHQMLATLDGGRLSIAAMGLGGAQGAFELALKYAGEREQFGRPIGSFQVNAFKLADMATEIELARLLLYKACWLCEQHRSFSKESAMAKMFCSEMYHRVANQAVQLHGGYGLMKEYAVERHYRNQKLLDIGEGTSEVQRIVIARHIGVPGRAF